MKIDILTLFPNMFDGFLNESIIKRAIDKGKVEVNIYNIRDYSKDAHKKVDDYQFGGGSGMVLMPQPIFVLLHPRHLQIPVPAVPRDYNSATDGMRKQIILRVWKVSLEFLRIGKQGFIVLGVDCVQLRSTIFLKEISYSLCLAIVAFAGKNRSDLLKSYRLLL